jgi:hypothetical protein
MAAKRYFTPSGRIGSASEGKTAPARRPPTGSHWGMPQRAVLVRSHRRVLARVCPGRPRAGCMRVHKELPAGSLSGEFGARVEN